MLEITDDTLVRVTNGSDSNVCDLPVADRKTLADVFRFVFPEMDIADREWLREELATRGRCEVGPDDEDDDPRYIVEVV